MVGHRYVPMTAALKFQFCACNFAAFASICRVTSGWAGAPLPVADDARDREEFTASVRTLLERLRDEIPADAGEAAGGNEDVAGGNEDVAESDEEWRLLTVQLGRAKALPDYWQRFDAVRERFTADYVASGGARRGVLGRWLRRG